MQTMREIQDELTNSVTGRLVHHRISDHPGDATKKAYTLSIFAETTALLEEMVKEYQKAGYHPWIVGRMGSIPAAYLYKEL